MRENGRGYKFGSGVCGEVFADSGNAAELKVACVRDRRDALCHGEGVVEGDSKILDSRRQTDR